MQKRRFGVRVFENVRTWNVSGGIVFIGVVGNANAFHFILCHLACDNNYLWSFRLNNALSVSQKLGRTNLPPHVFLETTEGGAVYRKLIPCFSLHPQSAAVYSLYLIPDTNPRA